MGYTKQTWVNNDPSKPLDANRLNHVEDGVFVAAATADSAASGVTALNALTATGRLSEDALNTTIDEVAFDGAVTQQKQERGQDGALLRARAAFALAHTTRVNTLFLGHSMNSGYSVTSYKDMLHNAFSRAARAALNLPAAGEILHPIKSASSVNPSITDWPYNAGTPNLGGSGHGIPAGSGGWLNSAYSSHTITVPAGITSVGVWTGSDSAQPGGTFSWAIDGGSATNVNTSADAQTRYGYKRLTEIPIGDPSVSHTLVLAIVSGWVCVDSVEFFNGDATSGVHSFVHGQSGQTSTQMLTSIRDAYNTGTGLQMASLAHLAPALIVFTGIVNDYSGGSAGANPVSSATARTNIASILETVAGLCGSVKPSIVINIEHQRNNLAMTEPWQSYVDMAYDLAADNGYAVFDGGKMFGTLPTPANAAGLLNADLIHPSPAGMHAWARGLAQMVTPR